MRHLLVAAVVAATVLPGAAARAEDPACEVVDNLYDVGACNLGHQLLDHDYAATTVVVSCPSVTGTLPGTTPTNEAGQAACTMTFGFTAATPGPGQYAGDFAYPATFRYGTTGGATLAAATGWFTLDVPSHELQVSGTVVRSGAAWAFEGAFAFRYEGWGPVANGPFVATGIGAPTAPGFALTIAG